MNPSTFLFSLLRQPKYFLFYTVFSTLFSAIFGLLIGLASLPWLNPALFLESVTWEILLPNILFSTIAAHLNTIFLTLSYYRFTDHNPRFFQTTNTLGGLSVQALLSAAPFGFVSAASIVGVLFVTRFYPNFFLWFEFVVVAALLLAIQWTLSWIETEKK